MALHHLGYIWALLTIALDQATKLYMLHVVLADTRHIVVAEHFNLVTVWNKGTSFSLISNHHEVMPFVLAALAIGICIWLHRWLLKAEGRWQAAALGMVIGGALGNVVDRLLYGAVFDFLDFHVSGWHWPAFNIADCGVVVGVGLLVLGGFKKTA